MRTQDVALGFLAHPETRGQPGKPTAQPGIVMIPDVRGLYDHYRELAKRLARAGFTVLALDPYRREGPPEITDAASAMRWIATLSDPLFLADVQAAVTFLADHPAVAGRRVGITGFCMGGQYALLAACRCRDVAACVAFYGMLSYAPDLDPKLKPCSPLDALSDLTCPLLGLYGEEDALIPVSDVRELEAGLRRSGRPGEVKLYAGAGHAFLNDTRPDTYRAEAARDAWQRMVGFFRKHLAPP